MAEPKTLLVSRGRGDPQPMSVEAYNKMMRALSPQARREVFVRGTVTGVVKDEAGRLVRQELTHEEVAARLDRGENPIVDTPKDPRLDVIRQQDRNRAQYEYADEENLLHAVNKATPFIGQKLQNLAVGDDEAAQARAELKRANAGIGLGVDVAMMALGGAGAAGLAARYAPALAAGLKTTSGIRGFANIMGAGALADTYLYGQYLADTNQPFRIEEYARELATGALITLPIAVGAASRNAALGLIGKGLESGGDLAGKVGEAFTVRGLLSPVGSRGVDRSFRYASVARIVSRFGRRLQGKKSLAAIIDPVADAERASSQMHRALNQVHPEKLAKMERGARQELLNTVRGWADVPDLNIQHFEVIPEKLRASEKVIQNTYKQIDKLNKNTGDWTLGIGGRASKKQKGAYVAAMEEMLGSLESAGWRDVSGDLADLLRFDADGKLLGNPHENFGRLVQARLDARLKAGSLGGASQAEQALKKVIANSDIWGTGKHPKIAKQLNDAIEDLADAQANLSKLNDVKKNVVNIEAGDVKRIEQTHAEIEKMMRAYEALRDTGMLSAASVRDMKGFLKQATDALTDSLPAYRDAAKINQLRDKAAGLLTDRLARVHQAAPDFEARMRASIHEQAERIDAAKNSLLKAVKTGSDVAAGVSLGGVVLLRELSRQERDLLYDHLSEELPKMAGSPEYMQHSVEQLLGGTALENPEFSSAAGIQLSRTLYYLASKLPPPRYSMYNSQPPRLQKEAFLQTYAAIMDPVSVLYAAGEGRATPEMIEALRVTQPAMYAELSNAAVEALVETNPKKAKRKTINGINAFLGGLDPLYRGEALMRLQQHWAQSEVQSQAINGQGSPQALQKSFSTKDTTDRGNDFTFTQRLASY